MDTSTDYYAILGVDSQANNDAIKAAFKKLALQYHPDVYKGADAQERMRRILQAYQVLGDPVTRREYDAQRRGKSKGGTDNALPRKESASGERSSQDKRYAFPDLSTTPISTFSFKLGSIVYQLSSAQAETLRWDGVLQGVAREPVVSSSGALYSCHRCNRQWPVPPSLRGDGAGPLVCPACHARDWSEYLLLRCIHCHAVFESKEIADPLRGGSRYHPYELFPLCPHCRRSQWCPAENQRVAALRAAAARRSTLLWSSAIGAGVLLFVLIALMYLFYLK